MNQPRMQMSFAAAINSLTLSIALLFFWGCALDTTQRGLHLEPTMSGPVLTPYIEASQALQSGDLNKAREAFQQALSEAHRLNDDAGVGYSLAGLGKVYLSLYDYPKSLEFFSDALPYFRKSQRLPPEGETLVNIGNVSVQMKNPQFAIDAFNKALVIGDQLLPKASDQERQTILGVRADVFFWKGKSQQDLGENTEAVRSYRFGASDYQSIGDKKRAGKMLELAAGVLQQQLKAHNEAIEEFSRAISLFQEAGDAASATWARVGLAWSYADAGRLNEAQTIFSDVVQATEHDDSSELAMNGHLGLGRVLEAQGRFEEALRQYEAILQLTRNAQESIDASAYAYSLPMWEANASSLMGYIYWYLSRYEDAVEHLQEAAVKYDQVGATEAEAGVLTKLAEIFYWVGDPRTGMQDYNQALKLYEQSGNKSKQVEVLAALGESGWLSGQILGADADEKFNKAQELLSSFTGVDIISLLKEASQGKKLSQEEIDAIFQQWRETLPSTEANKLEAAGALYQKMGRVRLIGGMHESAVATLSAAVSYHQNLRPTVETSYELGKDCFFLGEAYLGKKEFDQALLYFQAAEKLAQQFDSSEIHWVYWGLARTYAELGKIETAVEYYKTALQTLENVRGLQANEEIKIGVFARAVNMYRGFVGLLVDLDIKSAGIRYLDDAFQANERLRARSFLENLTRSRATKVGSDLEWLTKKQQEIERQLAQIHHQLRSANLASNDESLLLDKQNNVLKDWRDSQDKAAHENLKYGQIVRPKPVTLGEVQNVLDTDTILLEYSFIPDGLILWAVSKEQVKVYRLPRQEAQVSLEKYLETIRAPLMTSDEVSTHAALGRTLYQTLLAPAEKLIIGKKRVIIASDGPLYSLPFEALIESDNSIGTKKTQKLSEIPYLIKKFQVAYIPSASILVQQWKDRREQKNAPRLPLVAFGDPVYGTETLDRPDNSPAQVGSLTNITTRGLNFSRLKFSGEEVKRIASIWGVPLNSEDINLRNRASVERVHELDLSKYRILHFATHAAVGDEIGYITQPALILSQAGVQGKDPGELQFNDILQLKLDADLVVLSACDTGLGKRREGEGIVGLTRAFLYAGARSIVSSLWKVQDQSTSLLMEGFHRRLKQGQSKVEALRQAKLELIQSKIELLGIRESLAAPFYWAPFVLVGDWQPMRQN